MMGDIIELHERLVALESAHNELVRQLQEKKVLNKDTKKKMRY